MNNFYRAIWFLKVSMIVMLCDPTKDTIYRCHGYNHEFYLFENKEFEIDFPKSNGEQKINDNVVLRIFTLKHIESGLSREIKHYSFLNWIDQTAVDLID